MTPGKYSDGRPFYKLDCWKLATDDTFKTPKVPFTGSTLFIHDISEATWETQNKWKKHGQCKLPHREHEAPIAYKSPAWRRTRKRVLLNREPVKKANKRRYACHAHIASQTAATGGDYPDPREPVETRGYDHDSWQGGEDEMQDSFPELFADDDSYKDMAIKRVFRTDYQRLNAKDAARSVWLDRKSEIAKKKELKRRDAMLRGVGGKEAGGRK